MKKNIIFCDGGLANRLNSLIFGLILREKYKGDWEISWPINNWCSASFYDLFDIDIDVNNNALGYYKEKEKEFILIMHENQNNFEESAINYQNTLVDYSAYSNFLKQEKPIFYYHNLIPNFVNLGEISEGVKNLTICSELEAKAILFCKENKVDTATLGLHIRKTDFGEAVDDQKLFEMASNSPCSFFVCTDDQKVSNRFADLKNCFVFKKQYFPEKMLGNLDWNGLTIDDQGRVFNFNINRNSNSVREALIDLLILSKTTPILTSQSTFLRMAILFKSINYFKINSSTSL